MFDIIFKGLFILTMAVIAVLIAVVIWAVVYKILVFIIDLIEVKYKAIRIEQELNSYFDDGVGAVMIDKLKEIRDCGTDVDDIVPYDYQYRINNLIIEIESFKKDKE